MEQKISIGSETKILDEQKGIVEAFVNTMGVVDSDGDVIAPSAFDKSLEKNLPIPVLSSHNQAEVVGKVVAAKSVPVSEEGPHRLHATMQMNLDTQGGREAFSNISGNFVREWSVGFNMGKDSSKIETQDGMQVRVIDDLDWVETSSVIRGASPETQTISAKSNQANEEVETAPDTTAEVASGTDTTALMLEIMQLKLKLSQAKKEA